MPKRSRASRRKRSQKGGFSLSSNLKAVSGKLKPAASKFTSQVVKPAAGVIGRKLLDFSQSKTGASSQSPIVAVAAVKTADQPTTVVSASATGSTPEAALQKVVTSVAKTASSASYSKKIPTYKTPKYAANYVSPYRQPGKKGGRKKKTRSRKRTRH